MELTFTLEVAGEIGNLLIHRPILVHNFLCRQNVQMDDDGGGAMASVFNVSSLPFWLKLRFVQLQISFILQELFSISDVPTSPTFGRVCKNFKFTESAQAPLLFTFSSVLFGGS
jgi:hypothetical protein